MSNMDSKFSMYVLSNGSSEYYPDNTLSKFSTKLPFSLDLPTHLNERWGIAIQGIGLSSKFTSEYSMNSQMPLMIELIGLEDLTQCENLNFTVDQDCLTVKKEFNQIVSKIMHKTYSDIDSTRFYNNDDIVEQLDTWAKLNIRYFYGKVTIDDTYDTSKQITVGYNFFYNTLKDKESLEELIKGLNSHSLNVERKCDTNIIFSNKDFDIERIFFIRKDLFDKSKITQNIKYKTNNNEISSDPSENYLFDNYINARNMNTSSLTINNTTYILFVMNKEFRSLNLDFEKFSENYLSIPNVIKIKCDNIRSQIFNNSHSKDIEIIKPKFQFNMGHYFHEFENPLYVPLLNTTLRDLTFELTDEYNDRVNLSEGIATLLQISFKRMPSLVKSFSVRLSPIIKTTSDFINTFEIILPSTLNFNENWRVGLKEITFPSSIKSLPNDKNEIFINLLDDNMQKIPLATYRSSILNNAFDSESLIKHLNERTSMFNLLNFSMNDDNLFVTSKSNCDIGISYNLAKFFNMKIPNPNSKFVKMELLKDTPTKIGKVDWYIFRPAYLMIYSDLVKPTLISSSYANILRIVPVKSVEKDIEYQSTEFKNVEFRELSNNVVNIIKVDIRSHSGELVQFNSNFISLHLYFTNNPF